MPSRKRMSISFTSLSANAVLLIRKAAKIRYIQIKKTSAQIANISSTMVAAATFFSKAFISATTVMHRPDSVAETESRCSNSSRIHEMVFFFNVKALSFKQDDNEHIFYVAGSSSVAFSPNPDTPLLLSLIEPLCLSAIIRAMVNPKPVPPELLDLEFSMRLNG